VKPISETDAGKDYPPHASGTGRRISYWDTGVRELLEAKHGPAEGARLADRWIVACPAPYKAAVAPMIACIDIVSLDRLASGSDQTLVTLKHEPGPDGTFTRIALFSRHAKTELSHVVGLLEDLGLNVIEERPAHIISEEDFWLQDFGVLGPDGEPLALEQCGERVAACIDAVLRGEAESDRLHRLIVTTNLDHRQLGLLRAFRSYRSRIGSRYTDRFQNEAIVSHPEITANQLRHALQVQHDAFDKKRVVQSLQKARAKQEGWKMNIAIVDSGGNMKYFLRQDDAFLKSIEIAQLKAGTSAGFPFSTKQIGEITAKVPGIAFVPGIVTFEGGLPSSVK